MKVCIRVILVFFLCRAVIVAADYPMPRPVEQPLAVFKAERAGNVRQLLDTITAGVFGLSVENRGGRLPGMETGPESYDAFFDALIENGAEELWYALPQNGTMLDKRTAGAGWRLPDWDNGLDGATEWLESLGFDPHAVAFGWDGENIAIGSDSVTLDRLTSGNVSNIPWSKRLVEFLGENPEGVGLYFYPRPVIGALAMLTGEDILSEMARLRLNQPHSGTIHAYSLNNDFIGFDMRVDDLFARPPYLTDASRYTLVSGEADRDDMVRITIAEPMPYLELLGLDRNFLYPLNIDTLAFVPEVATINLWMDEYRHWNWSVVCLIKDKERFKRQYRRLTGWVDLLARTPLGYVDMDMVETPDGDAVRRLRIGDFEFCLGVGENDRVGADHMMLIASGRVEDFPGVDQVRLEKGGVRRAVEWDVKLGEESRYALADYIGYQLRRKNMDVPGIDVLETAIPPEENGSLRVEGTNVLLTSPQGIAAWLAPVLPEMEREILYRMFP